MQDHAVAEKDERHGSTTHGPKKGPRRLKQRLDTAVTGALPNST